MGAWRCLLAFCLVVTSIGVSGLLFVESIAAEACVVDASTRSFTGDCYFDQNPLKGTPCSVDFPAGTYSAGCLVYANPEDRPVRPIEVPPGCDRDELDPNNFTCPPDYDGPFTPAPGWSCTYDDANANYECEPLVPEELEDCTFDPLNENWTCPDPEASPSPSGAPPCGVGPTVNLICNGDFSSATQEADYTGGWYGVGYQPCGTDSKYVQRNERAWFAAQGSYYATAGMGAPCPQVGTTSNQLEQWFTAPSYSGTATITVELTVYGGDFPFSPPKAPACCGDEYSQISPRLLGNGTGGGAGLFTDAGGAWDTCGGASNPFNGGGIYRFAGPVTCTFTQTVSATSNFWPGFVYRLAFYDYRGTDVYLDDVVVTLTGGGVPSPSPSPSPSPGVGFDPPGYDCTYDEVNENYVCLPEGTDNPAFDCDYVEANENYICDGPIPPGNPPAGSDSPTGSPAPGASATPGRDGPGTGGGGGSGCVAGDSLIDLPGHGRYLGCLLISVRDTIIGVALGFARALGAVVDVVLGLWSMVKAGFDALVLSRSVLWWLLRYVLAIGEQLVSSLGADPADITLLGPIENVLALPLMAQVLTVVAGVPWFAFALWLLRRAGRLNS